MRTITEQLADGRSVQVRFTERSDGDFHVDAEPAALAARRNRVAPHPWTWLRQVHGSAVVRVNRPGGGAGRSADAAWTEVSAAVLAVQTADCAPVVLIGNRSIGAAHAGWAGACAGVLEATAAEIRGADDGELRAIVGPCIQPAAYAFGADDLNRIADRYGDAVRAETDDGHPALSMPALVSAALASAGVSDVQMLGDDTSDPRWFSHRTRRDAQRQTTAVWIQT